MKPVGWKTLGGLLAMAAGALSGLGGIGCSSGSGGPGSGSSSGGNSGSSGSGSGGSSTSGSSGGVAASSSSGATDGGSSGSNANCTNRSTLPCSPGTDGIDCPPGADPGFDFPGYLCSTASPQADGTVGYCCAYGFDNVACIEDHAVSGCAYPSVGIACPPPAVPTMAVDPMLTCGAGVADPSSGNTLFCCK